MKRFNGYYLLHPFLFALYPLLFLYSNNLGKVEVADGIVPLGVIFSSCLVLLGLFRLVLGDVQKSTAISTVWIFLIFSFGHIYNAAHHGTQDFYTASYVYTFILWLVLFSLSLFWVIATKTSFLRVNKLLFNIGCALLIITSLNIFLFMLKNRKTASFFNKSNGNALVQTTYATNNKPDVYYIILDRYARADILRDFYGFDNSEFLNFLKNKGFYVADKSHANYLKTTHSLSSSLNMTYLGGLAERYGESSSDWRPLYHMLTDYPVWRIFKESGYKFLHFGTRWEPTNSNIYADENINLHYMPEFDFRLYKTTYLDAAGRLLGVFDDLRTQWARERHKLARLKEVAISEQPTFTFAHFLIPHPPFVFSQDGSYVKSAAKQTLEEQYLSQVRFINLEMEEIISTILSKSPNSIIIIQSDEGPHPSLNEVDQYTFDWLSASKDDLRKKMAILNVYYFPNREVESKLYKEITPVNTFRLLFDTYFGTDYGLLEDRNYIYQDYQHPFKFIEVTENLI